MIQRVKLQERREELIMWLLDLSDREYQEAVWVMPGRNTGFYYNLKYSVDMIFEELDLDEKDRCDKLIGLVFKSEKEALYAHKLALALEDFFDDPENSLDEEYLNSPYWQPMVAAAKEAFDIFMENEKDNKEFCEFVERVKLNMQKKIAEAKGVH